MNSLSDEIAKWSQKAPQEGHAKFIEQLEQARRVADLKVIRDKTAQGAGNIMFNLN